MWRGLDLMGMRRPGNKWTLFQNTLQRCFKPQLCFPLVFKGVAVETGSALSCVYYRPDVLRE